MKNAHQFVTTITHRSYLSAGDIPCAPQKTGKGDGRGRTGRFRDPVLATAGGQRAMRVRRRMARRSEMERSRRVIRRRTRIALCPNAGVSTGSLNLPVRPRLSPFPSLKKTLTYGGGYNRIERYIRKNSTGSSQQQRCDSINTMMETSGII